MSIEFGTGTQFYDPANDPRFAAWNKQMGNLTTRGASGLWNAYDQQGGDESGVTHQYINPYDAGGGYTSLADAQTAAQSMGGQFAQRKMSSDEPFSGAAIKLGGAFITGGASGMLGDMVAGEGIGAGVGESVSGDYAATAGELGGTSAGAAASGNPYAGSGGIGASYGGAGDYAAAPGSGMGSSVAASGGGSIMDTIKSWLGPTGIPGISGKDVLSTGLNYLNQRRVAGQYNDLANRVRQSGSALYDPQRQQYQGNLEQLVNNPSKYLSTDPFATSLSAMYRDKVIPRNIAASGNPGQVIDEKGSQFVNALAGNYNTQVGQMSGIAGFGFPPSGYTPSAVGTAGGTGINAGASAIGGLANLLGRNQMPAAGTAGTGASGTLIT